LGRTTLAVPRQAASIPRLRAWLDALLSPLSVTSRCREELALVLTEASSNAVRHGRGDAPIEVAVEVELGAHQPRCLLEIGNCDGEFDEAKLRAGLPAPEQETGRGLPLIGALSDAVHILRPRPGWVVLRIAKRLETA
jgi:serine/threonine-protein kinase RsbW